MSIWSEMARACTPAGDDVILRRRGDLYEIRFNGIELMSNITHQSEFVLAERSLRRLEHPARTVLVAGLGMGFTLRAALDALGPDARVTVCELIPDIVHWNRKHIGHLAGHPLNDPRVEIHIADVMDVLGRADRLYDAILMDTDNGPDFTVRNLNQAIYAAEGLQSVRRALASGGIAAFWSSTISRSFETSLSSLQWPWMREDICLAGGRADAFHHIYMLGFQGVALQER